MGKPKPPGVDAQIESEHVFQNIGNEPWSKL